MDAEQSKGEIMDETLHMIIQEMADIKADVQIIKAQMSCHHFWDSEGDDMVCHKCDRRIHLKPKGGENG